MLFPVAAPEPRLDEEVDAERDDEEDGAEGDAVPEFALGRFESDRGRDVPGDVPDVAAEHHGDPDFGDGPGEPGQHGDEKGESGLAEDDPPRLAPAPAPGEEGGGGAARR